MKCPDTHSTFLNNILSKGISLLFDTLIKYKSQIILIYLDRNNLLNHWMNLIQQLELLTLALLNHLDFLYLIRKLIY